MISIAELKQFTEQHVADRPNIENYFMVASDDELAKLYKDVVNDRDECTMVVLVPSHDSNIPDEDDIKTDNNLTFMIIKKTDGKAGHDEKIRVFGITQEEIKQLLLKIIGLYQNFGTDCAVRNMDLNSIKIDPVQDYVGSNGYGIDFTTTTNL